MSWGRVQYKGKNRGDYRMRKVVEPNAVGNTVQMFKVMIAIE